MTTILIVDDSPIVRNLMKRHLKGLSGVRVVEAVHGKDALEKVMAEVPDVMISDVNMPEMNGMQLVGEVRKILTKNELPILMVSTLGEEDHVARALDLGANDYLTKPFVAHDLALKVRALEVISEVQMLADLATPAKSVGGLSRRAQGELVHA